LGWKDSAAGRRIAAPGLWGTVAVGAFSKIKTAVADPVFAGYAALSRLHPSGALRAYRAKAEQAGKGDFTSLWSGQAARLGRELPAGELTRVLISEALARMA